MPWGLGGVQPREGLRVPCSPHLQDPAPSCLGPPKEPGEAQAELAPGETPLNSKATPSLSRSRRVLALVVASARLLLPHGLGLGHLEAALPSDAPDRSERRGEARRASTWPCVGRTGNPRVGEAADAGDSKQVQGLCAVFNYPHPSSPWRTADRVHLPPPHRCCWH